MGCHGKKFFLNFPTNSIFDLKKNVEDEASKTLISGILLNFSYLENI